MTPKEKAEELVHKFKKYSYYPTTNDDVLFVNQLNYNAKQSALIAVDEIINSRNDDRGFDDTLSSVSNEYYTLHPMYFTYWKEVKQELEKL
jgi:hypothetical protein